MRTDEHKADKRNDNAENGRIMIFRCLPLADEDSDEEGDEGEIQAFGVNGEAAA